MRQSRLIMGMPVQLEIVDPSMQENYEEIFDYFISIDDRFSTYKDESEISKINRGELAKEDYSPDMLEVFALSEETKNATNGYFDIHTPDGSIDPSGLVKGWAIQKAAEKLHVHGFTNFYIDIGGDIQTSGKDATGKDWSIGIRNPLNVANQEEVVKVIYPRGKGIATSGSYLRGTHIYNPHVPEKPDAFLSLTVIGPNVYEADRFATAAFAMGQDGVQFIAELGARGFDGFEAYAIDEQGMALYTPGFDAYTFV